MALIFVEQDKATFKTPTVEAYGKDISIQGVNSTLQSAEIICDGVDSLLACASLSGNFAGAVRTVKQNVDDDDE